jgi:hypothetical protein
VNPHTPVAARGPRPGALEAPCGPRWRTSMRARNCFLIPLHLVGRVSFLASKFPNFWNFGTAFARGGPGRFPVGGFSAIGIAYPIDANAVAIFRVMTHANAIPNAMSDHPAKPAPLRGWPRWRELQAMRAAQREQIATGLLAETKLYRHIAHRLRMPLICAGAQA